MRSVIFAAIICFVVGSPAQAQRSQPPCGPASQLPGEFSTNVAADSRCFEIRMYTADTSRDGVGDYQHAIDELHQRFRENEVAIFEKHGAEVVAVWQSLENSNTLIWMLAYRGPRPSERGLGSLPCRSGVDRSPSEIPRRCQ